MASIALVARAPFFRVATSEQAAELVVHAVNDSGEPAANFPVVFTAAGGGVDLGGERAKSVIVNTDNNGRAYTMAAVTAPGTGTVRAHAGDSGEGSVQFVLRTPGVAHHIDMMIDGPITADDGVFRVCMIVTDINGDPVRQASIVVTGCTMEDVAIRSDALARGGGAYEAFLPARHAGDWTVTAVDRSSRAREVRRIHVSPGKAARIATAFSDARRTAPYNRADLRARIEDAAGNTLDPCSLVATIDGKPLQRTWDGDGATFPITQTGAGDVAVEVTDRRSGLTATAAVPFAHFWMMLPDIVRPGATYCAEVRALPWRDRTLEKGKLTIDFDPKMVTFAGHHPSANRLVTLSEPTIFERSVAFEFTSERPLEAAQFPEGISLGEMEWTCQGEGMTCFDVGGAMSPGIPGWMLCLPQKEEAVNRQCICINIIYRSSRPQDRQIGYAMADQIVYAITENLYECCPLLTARKHLGIIDENSDEWKEVTKDWLGDVPWNADEIEAVFNSGIGQRDNCLNLYVLDLGHAGLAGYARRPSWRHNGAIAVDPDSFGRLTNVAAHEAGHALGLDHHDEGFGLNLMTPGDSKHKNPARRLLAQWQCKIIWQNLKSYPC